MSDLVKLKNERDAALVELVKTVPTTLDGVASVLAYVVDNVKPEDFADAFNGSAVAGYVQFIETLHEAMGRLTAESSTSESRH